MTTQVVLPGDLVKTASSSESIRLGPGVTQLPGSTSTSTAAKAGIANIRFAATRAGILGSQAHAGDSKKPVRSIEGPTTSVESCWVEGQAKRYNPALGEPVIGIIVARHAEGYRVDIGGSQMAALDALAFEDATKRNKPNLKVGAVVYARVALALPFCEPELECVDPKTGKSQGFGELSSGMLLRHLELGKCRALLSPSHPLLPSLGRQFPFELAIGMNGRIWVKTAEIERTIQLMKAIQDA